MPPIHKKNLVVHKGINNNDVSNYVNEKKNFNNNNDTMQGIQYCKGADPHVYVVYSYGSHYPMFVYDYGSDKWLGNNSKTTPTTERHKKCAWPNAEIHAWYDTYTLQNIITEGFIQILTERIEGARPYERQPQADPLNIKWG